MARCWSDLIRITLNSDLFNQDMKYCSFICLSWRSLCSSVRLHQRRGCSAGHRRRWIILTVTTVSVWSSGAAVRRCVLLLYGRDSRGNGVPLQEVSNRLRWYGCAFGASSRTGSDVKSEDAVTPTVQKRAAKSTLVPKKLFFFFAEEFFSPKTKLQCTLSHYI